MATYRNAPDNVDCASTGSTVFIGNVALAAIDPKPTTALAATALLTIDVISAPGSELCVFHFVTLTLRIEAPAGALFVHHRERGNYHREILADPDAEVGLDTDLVYWRESDDPAPILRIREDETALLSGPGNGRTYQIGIVGFDPQTQALRLTAAAAASLVRETSCHLVIDELRDGERIAGYLETPPASMSNH